MSTRKNKDWSIDKLLSGLMGYAAEVKPNPRSEIWASDIGKPFSDRWLSMKGIPYSNPIDGKSLANFFLGKQIELGLIEMLKGCGLAFQSQDRIVVNEPGCLPVAGRPDLILGVEDWNLVFDNINKHISELLSSGLEDVGVQIEKQNSLKELVRGWSEAYPNGLPKTIFEIKTINTNAFNFHKRGAGLSEANPQYKLQLYTYMKSYGLDGRIVYVSKNDGRMEEVIVNRTLELEAEWLADVQTMTRYYYNDSMPEKEPLMVNGKRNWKIDYSRYKDFLYNNYKNNQGIIENTVV